MANVPDLPTYSVVQRIYECEEEIWTLHVPTPQDSKTVQYPLVFSDVSNWVMCLFIHVSDFILPTGLIALLL